MAAPISINQGPSAEAWTALNDYDGPGNQTYVGIALSTQRNAFTFTGATISKANPGVVTYVAHGLISGQAVTISGGTGDWAALNATHKITVIDADTFSIPVNTSAYAGSFAGAVATYAPRTNALCWSISQTFYNGGNQATRTANCNGNTSPNYAWDSRTTYPYA